MALLLRGLAVACPALEELRVLPEALCGLGDDEMPLLAAMKGLRVGEGAGERVRAVRPCGGLPGAAGQQPYNICMWGSFSYGE
jgi:hypothetical protein